MDGTVDATPTVPPADPPEPYQDIARLPGLGWRSAVAAAMQDSGNRDAAPRDSSTRGTSRMQQRIEPTLGRMG